MNFLLKISLGILLVIISFKIHAQENKTLSVVLLSSKDSTPVANAHIVNHKSNIGTTSNIKGEFTISTHKDDSVMITKIGYQTVELHEASVKGNIYLKVKDYELDEFTVIPYKNFQEFKEAFAKIEILDNKPKLNRSIFLSVEELKRYDGSRGFGGGISALLGMFNKHMKDKKNYDRLVARDKYDSFLATKFNAQMVKKITRIDNVQTLQDFIDYCDFTDQFIEHGSEYDIITQVYECYDEYNSLEIASK